MTNEVYKKLSDWNPKKGDVFKSKAGGTFTCCV